MNLPSKKSTRIAKECMVGGPVTAVQFVPSTSKSSGFAVLYGHGPYLCRTQWYNTSTNSPAPNTSECQPNDGPPRSNRNNRIDRLLVFENGGSIHGIRHANNCSSSGHHHQDDDAKNTITAIFGGRQIRFVAHAAVVTTAESNNTMHECNMHVVDLSSTASPMAGGGGGGSDRCLEFNDWIWDCRLEQTTPRSTRLPNASTSGSISPDDVNRSYPIEDDTFLLFVGLAHNRVQVYSMVLSTSTATPSSPKEDPVISVGVDYPHRHRREQNIASRTTNLLLTCQLQQDHFGFSRCLTYCMAIWCNSSCDNEFAGTTVAVGTLSNTILVWSLSNEQPWTESSATKILLRTKSLKGSISYDRSQEHVLTGHRGVIHAVKFHPSGQQLASTSDDRTVRLWVQQQQEPSSYGTSQSDDGDCFAHGSEKGLPTWLCIWAAWGHTARGWDVAFAQTRSPSLASSDDLLSSSDDSCVVLSTGEDGTLRAWKFATGESLFVARGHSCQCIWKVAASTMCTKDVSANLKNMDSNQQDATHCVNTWIATGSNDGTVAFYNLNDRLPFEINRVKEQSGKSVMHQCGTWQTTFLVPNDRSKYLEHTAASNGKQKNIGEIDRGKAVPKKKAKWVQKETVVGMEFTRNFADDNSLCLIIATRSGSLHCLETRNGNWISLEPWRLEDLSRLELSDDSWGCSMSLHSTMPIAVVGTNCGDIFLSQLRRNNIDMTTGGKDLDRIILDARRYRSAQKLEWIRRDVLVSFHIQSVLVWHFLGGDEHLFARYTVVELSTGLNGLAISTAISPAITGRLCSASAHKSSNIKNGHPLLAIGDTRGNLVLFNLSSIGSSHLAKIAPMSALREAHMKEHVTSILWEDYETIVSVGNDAHIVKSTIDASGRLVKLLSVHVGSFSGIFLIWNMLLHDGLSSIVVGGYYGNIFAVVDVTCGYEFLSIDTGGRQRTIEVFAGKKHDQIKFPVPLCIAVCHGGRHSCNEIVVHGFGDKWFSRLIKRDHAIVPHSLGTSLHGESIFAIQLFPIDRTAKSIALLTASEDCSARICTYRDGKISTAIILPSQVSGIRAVCSVRIDFASTVVILGGKIDMHLFLICDLNVQDHINVEYLGHGRSTEKASIDHRINSIAAATLTKANGDNTLLVVSGDSNGSCYLHIFTETTKYALSGGQLLFQDERPILSVSLVQYFDRYLLVTGGTAGLVSVFDLRGASDLGVKLVGTPILTYSAHSMGTNAIASVMISSEDNGCILRICSGGDDQAVCCCDVHLTESFPIAGAVIERIIWGKESSMSAVKGVGFIDNSHIAISGYDQQLSVWRCDGDCLVSKATIAVDIGDINCLSATTLDDGNHLVAVGGAGVELLLVDQLLT